MFVISFKSSTIKAAAMGLILTACAVMGVYAAGRSVATAGKRESAAISYRASNAVERAEFLSQFGWEIGDDPVEVSEVIIPDEFDGAYEDYNNIQKQHGLDLKDYAGSRVKRWTYEVKNYPGYEGKEGFVQANIFVLDGMVIGGDICSLERDGFISCLYFPESIEKESVTDADTTA